MTNILTYKLSQRCHSMFSLEDVKFLFTIEFATNDNIEILKKYFKNVIARLSMKWSSALYIIKIKINRKRFKYTMNAKKYKTCWNR